MTDEARTAYLARMKNCRPFKSFGITPEWFPGTEDVEGFIHDEVVRQYHDTRVRDDGGVRIEWMHAAWDYARREANLGNAPTTNSIIALGTLVEPQITHMTFRDGNVYIGSGIGAPPRLIGGLVTYLAAKVGDVRPNEDGMGSAGHHADEYRALWHGEHRASHRRYDILNDADIVREFTDRAAEIETADDWYLAYEAIHPFADGNGRTGKILHNWLKETLDDPVLVHDYFGGGNP